MNRSKIDIFYRFASRLLTERLRQKIFFLHIPKCGGTSISKALRECYGINKFKQNNFHFHLDASASLNTAKIADVLELEFLQNLLIYNMSIRSHRYISGHFVYSERAFRKFGDEWNFVTLLRHPVSKWFSKYFFNRYKKTSHYKLDLDLETYLESKVAIAEGSDYVRCLTGVNPLHGLKLENTVELAIQNLNNFAVIGVLEKINTFAKDFERKFDVKLFIEHLRKNPLPKNRQEPMITDKIRQRVEEICQPDIQIYNAALKKTKSRGAA